MDVDIIDYVFAAQYAMAEAYTKWLTMCFYTGSPYHGK